jgi:16S rRNA (cytidine1402-2'-O)-methyltransferase
MAATVYLLPSPLADEALYSIPGYVLDAVKNCQVFFAENERTTRRYFKQLWKEMVIDDYEWHTIDDHAAAVFRNALKEAKTVGIISEAGCPGVADPGQSLIAIAQEMNAVVRPLVGPNAVLLALMGSGMSGQRFQFSGYLPIDSHQRMNAIKELEAESAKKNCTQLFIETPYRNNQLLEALLQTCKPSTRLCIASMITGKDERIRTKRVDEWKANLPNLHKQPVIFCLSASAEPLT